MAASDSTAQPNALSQLIDARPITAVQLFVIALCAASMIVDGYDIQVMALAVPTLSRSWALPPASFELALSAIVIGISLGSGLLGPLADRFGRRTLLTLGMLAAGIATLCTASSSSLTQFVLWRTLTGLAMGAAIPSCAALTSEYAPLPHRSLAMSVINIGPPIGAFAAGFIAPPVLEAFGWRGTFLIGGAAPLLIAGVALFVPESLKFMLTRRPSDPRIARYLRRLAPDVEPASVYMPASANPPRASPLALLNRTYRARTMLLWGLVGLNLFNLYVLVSWLPTILEQSGWSAAGAIRGAVLIQAGGVVGGLTMSRFLDRGATKAAMVTGFTLAAVCMALFAVLPSGPWWVLLLLLTGVGVSGSQTSVNALSAAYYPPAIKATGVSWALLIGGIGSIIGPIAGGRLISWGLSPTAIVALLAIPSLACALGAAVSRREWQAD